MDAAPRYPMQIRWADLDANGHVRHSVYLDLAAQARVSFLHDHGFTVARFQELGIGPILFSETARYLRELHSNQQVEVDLWLTGLSANGKHWAFRHHVIRSDGEVSCVVDCRGAWFDTRERKVIPMPEALAETMGGPPRTEDYAQISSSS